MKQIISILSISAIALMALSSCQKENEMLQEKPSAKTAIMTVNAGSTTTKTAINEVDSKNYTLTWTAGDAIACYEVGVVESVPTIQGKTTSTALESDTANATFTINLSGNAADPNYSYIFVYPAAKYTKNTGANPIYRGQIPEKQTFSATSFDKDADLLISRAIANQAERPTSVNAEFERIGATALMNIKAPTTTEKIRSITFSTTENSAYLHGYVRVYPVEGTHDTDIYSGGHSLTLTPASSTTYSGTIPVWFRLGEITLSDNFTVKVTTDKKIYTKEVDLAGASRTIEFHNSGLTKFNVNMESVAGVDNPLLDDGEYYIVAKHGENYYAMSSAANGTRLDKVQLDDFVPSAASYNGANPAIEWTVTNDEDNQLVITSSSGQYLNSGAKAASTSETQQFFTVSAGSESGTLRINSVSNTGYGIRYNASSAYFAFYNSEPNASMIADVYIMPKDSRTRVSAPTNVEASASGSTITVIWDDASDANIDHYLVTLSGAADDSQDVAVGDEGYEFTGLSDGTYSVSVTAISNDHSSYLDSEATIIDNIVVGDPKGTIDNPYTASEILTNYPDGSGDDLFYVSGTITNIQEVSTEHGNATYTISDGVNAILVYRGKYINNASFTSGSQIAENDQVIVYGKIGVYNSTPQLAQGNYLYSLNGKTKVLTAGTVTATPDNANKQITVEWTAATGSSETISYHVTCGTQYYDANAAGNHTFTMADYGTYNVSVVASSSDAISATVSTSATLSDPGSGGDPQTYQHIFNAKPSTGNSVALSGVNWNIDATQLGSYNSANYAGVQIGTKSAAGRITLTSSSSWSYNSATTITEVRLWLNAGTDTPSATVTIGGVSAISDGTTVVKNSSASSYADATCVTFTPGTNGNTGVVVIDVSTSSKAAYICAMEIDCE